MENRATTLDTYSATPIEGSAPEPPPAARRTMYCPNCGNQLVEASSFCHMCGARLGPPPALPGPVRSSGPPVWEWVVLALLVGLAVILPPMGLYALEQGLVVPPQPESAPLELQFAGPQCPGWSNEWLSIPVDGGTVWMGFTLGVQGSAGSCTAQGVSILTPGFTLLSSNTPVTVSAGTYGTLNVTVRTPSTLPVGAVTMVVTIGSVTVNVVVP
jgi:zinc-ribbon domain